MPANHCTPHTEASKAKMSAARKGKPATWRRRPTIEVEGVTLFRCGRCMQFLPRGAFYSTKRTLLGITYDCKPCHSAVSISSRDPATTRAARQRSESTRRARKAGPGGRVTASDWAKVLDILGTHCLCCGSDAAPTQDHIVPLAKGGRHHPANLQPLCRPCNERKQARTMDYRTPEQITAIAAVWGISFKRLEAA